MVLPALKLGPTPHMSVPFARKQHNRWYVTISSHNLTIKLSRWPCSRECTLRAFYFLHEAIVHVQFQYGTGTKHVVCLATSKRLDWNHLCLKVNLICQAPEQEIACEIGLHHGFISCPPCQKVWKCYLSISMPPRSVLNVDSKQPIHDSMTVRTHVASTDTSLLSFLPEFCSIVGVLESLPYDSALSIFYKTHSYFVCLSEIPAPRHRQKSFSSLTWGMSFF